MTFHQLIPALLLLLYPHVAVAQDGNSTNTQNYTCSAYAGGVNSSTAVDASGTVEINTGSLRMYLTVGLNESGAATYLSVPNLEPTISSEVCLYRFGGLNVSATGPGMNGCEGVLTKACRNAIQKSIVMPKRNKPASSSDRPISCAGRANMSAIKAACGDVVTALGLTNTPYSTQLSNTTCRVQYPPGLSLQFRYEPSGYSTVPFALSPLSDRLKGPQESWDLHVRQVTPWVIASTYPSPYRSPTAEVVCTSFNWTRPGTRKPEGQWPPAGSPPGPYGVEDSAASALGSSSSALVAGVVAGLAVVISIW